MNPKHNLTLFVALAISMALGLIAVLYAAFGYGAASTRHLTWALLGVLLSPAPIFVGHRISLVQAQSGVGNAPGEGPSGPLELGYFFGAGLMASACIWPGFLLHLEVYNEWKAAATATAGVLIVLATGAIYHAVFNAADEDESAI